MTYTMQFRVRIRPIGARFAPILERRILLDDGADYWALSKVVGRARRRRTAAIADALEYGAQEGFPVLLARDA